ncbi:hypothetical protein T265_10325 [Opisthorchis viverrini]|uniref:Uncharacterized protein n=1 Tax=Opisthorchis viverrini TaxID=6198 RepID=A0A074Z6X4_OPIVI|nr:hypothetical protein T265_10325 [Opisthorchis viverrini]KER21322.1 hypothetical protein T265_10325 [Opisthorchis viverrini]
MPTDALRYWWWIRLDENHDSGAVRQTRVGLLIRSQESGLGGSDTTFEPSPFCPGWELPMASPSADDRCASSANSGGKLRLVFNTLIPSSNCPQKISSGIMRVHHGIKINVQLVAPFRCLAAMPPEGSTRAGILPGCPSLDRGSRVAEVGFEPRTFRLVIRTLTTSAISNHRERLHPKTTSNEDAVGINYECLDVMQTEEGTRARRQPGCSSLDSSSRDGPSGP